MAQVDARAKQTMSRIQASFEELGLLLGEALAAMPNRVVPKALWGSEVIILRPDWE